MDPVAAFLLTIAGVFLIGTLGEIVFRHTGVPDVVWLIVVGMVLGPIGGLLTTERLSAIAPYFAALTLIVILFEGGSRLRLGELGQAALRAIVLALSSFLVATAAIAVLSMILRLVGVLHAPWSWYHAFLLGSILGGSSSIVILPAMAQAKVPAKLANLVGLESAFTDAFCVVGAATLISLLVPNPGAPVEPLPALVRSLGMGLVIGAAGGGLWLLALYALHESEYASPITFAALLVLYVFIGDRGGSAALGILVFAVIVGNAGWMGRRAGLSRTLDLGEDVRGFSRQLAFIIKSFFFTFMGAMLAPPWSLIALGVVLGLVLFGARIPAVWLATLRGDFSPTERRLVAICLPRGMAAGVLATLPAAAGVAGTDWIPVAVFSAVLTTILLFAGGFPVLLRRLRAEMASQPVPPAPAVPALAPAVPAPAPVEPGVATQGGDIPQENGPVK
jgi:cell volume regulation protein A